MKTFNCDPDWPICLFDFTYKNKSNEFQAMRCKHNLKNYVVEDYFNFFSGIDKTKESLLLMDETDVIREQNTQLCQCLKKDGTTEKNYDFVKNFKICFIKQEEILYTNDNLIFNIDEENDVFEKKDNFIAAISG